MSRMFEIPQVWDPNIVENSGTLMKLFYIEKLFLVAYIIKSSRRNCIGKESQEEKKGNHRDRCEPGQGIGLYKKSREISENF